MEPITVIIWVCVIVFVITAALALLHVSGLYVLPNKEHGKALFRALIIQVVVIGVAAFGSVINTAITIPPEPPSDVCASDDPPFICITGEIREEK